MTQYSLLPNPCNIFSFFFLRRGCWFRLCSWCFPSNFLIECQVIQVNVGRLVDSAMTIPHPLPLGHTHPLAPSFPAISFILWQRASIKLFFDQHPDVCMYIWTSTSSVAKRTMGDGLWTTVWAACKSNFIFYEVPHRLRLPRPTIWRLLFHLYKMAATAAALKNQLLST